jgi:hypothetical protein
MANRLPGVTRLLPVFLVILSGTRLHAADHYVSPNASSSGTGTIGSPWTLQTALDQPGALNPGDTVWLRGGTYTGHYVSHIDGTSSSPIKVRAYPGERPKLNGNYGGNLPTLEIHGTYTWYWGFEIYNSSGQRWSSDGNSPSKLGEGIQVIGDHLKLIHLTIHDAAQGILTSTDANDTEIYGCLIYYNGYDASDRGHGHGIYSANAAGNATKKIYENLIFGQYGYGLHAYTEGGDLDNIEYKGNMVFENGVLSTFGYTTNILLGGMKNAANPKMTSNMTYTQGHVGSNNLGYSAGCNNDSVTNNYFSNGTALKIVNCTGNSITGNTFYGSVVGFGSSGYPNNTFFSSKPTGVKTFVRASAYEAGRANIAVYNWAGQSSVSVDVSAILGSGDGYEVRNAQDFFGAPVASGTYNGGSISLPMNNLSVATPYGVVAPDEVGPEFNAFILLPAASGGIPTPTRTPTKTPTGGPSQPTPTRTPTPGGGSGTIRLEAENAALVAPMQTGTSSYAFGGKYITSASAEAGAASWTFSVPTNADYVIWVRAIATSDVTDSVYVSKDGGSEDIYDANYGVWGTSWKWSVVNGRQPTGVPASRNPRVFPMTPGTHHLKFRTRNPNVKYDRIIITNDMTFVPTEAP